MLKELQCESLDQLIGETIPDNILRQSALDLEDALSEQDALAELQKIADKNQLFKSYLGMGYYGTYTPTVVQRNLLENPAWYTAYLSLIHI